MNRKTMNTCKYKGIMIIFNRKILINLTLFESTWEYDHQIYLQNMFLKVVPTNLSFERKIISRLWVLMISFKALIVRGIYNPDSSS